MEQTKNKFDLKNILTILFFMIFSLCSVNLFSQDAVAETDVIAETDAVDETDAVAETDVVGEEEPAPELKTEMATDPAPAPTPESDMATELEPENEKISKEEVGGSQKKKASVTVAIDKAQRTEYRKDMETGASIIVLEGDVQLSVTQSNDKTVITADLVNFDKDRQMLYAEGNVVLKKMSGSKLNETLTASNLLFNVETMEGVFDEGRIVQEQTDALNLPSGSTLVVASDIIGRDGSNTIAFKNGALTFCEDPDPHWKIKASRIWLLPGNEFAFFNALLYVGKIPVFYLPFFYYPKDEMIVNPSFGSDSRRGYHVQTTTYIIGRKPLESKSDEDSFFDFMRPTQLKKQVREGMFLHNLEENDSAPDKYMKIMADYYTNLGGMVGITGDFKPNKVITDLDFTLSLGFSRTLFYNSNPTSYIPFQNGETFYDWSSLFGLKLPFRYYADIKTTISHSIGNLTISLPLYSDAFFNSDFLTDRSESMDWIDFLMNSSTNLAEDVVNTSETSSFTWSLTGSLKPNIKKLNPYISNFGLSSITSSMTFYSKQAELESFKADTDNDKLASQLYKYSPQRKFYYPSQIVPFKATMNFAGTIFQYPKTVTTQKAEVDPKSKIAFVTPDELLTEEELAKVKEERRIAEEKAAEEKAKKLAEEAALLAEKTEVTEDADESDVAKTEDAEVADETDVAKTEDAEDAEDAEKFNGIEFPESMLPSITVATPTASSSSADKFKYSLTYSITPQFSSLINYDQTEIKSNADIDLKKILSSFYSITAPTELKSSMSVGSSIISMNNSLKFTPAFQAHPTLVEDEEGYVGSSKKDALEAADYAARKLDLQTTNSISTKPFKNTKYFSDSSITYNMSANLFGIKYDEIDEKGEPIFDKEKIDWDKDFWPSHNFNFVFSIKEKSNLMQKITFQATLPPRDDSYMGQINLTFPFMTFSAKTSVKKVVSTQEDVADYYKLEPFTQSSSWTLFNKELKLNQSYSHEFDANESAEGIGQVFDFDKKNNRATSLTFGLSYKNLSINYSHQNTYGYDLKEGEGWIIRDKEEFLPYSASLKYSMSTKNLKFWKDRVSLNASFSTNITADLIRPTNSYFTIDPTIKFSIKNFIDISFSYVCRNEVIFRYVQDWPGISDKFGIDEVNRVPGTTNPFEDIWASMPWMGEDSRKSSGFKMDSLNLKIEHNLHDWDLALEIRVKPTLITSKTPYEYNIDPYFSLSVLWRPMSSMKTAIVNEYDDDVNAKIWQLNPED